MPEIVDLPQHFLHRHEEWHHANHDIQRSGYGVSLLDFHRDLVADVLRWMRDQGRDLSLVQPWPSVPAELTADRTWTPARAASVRRILERPYVFRDLDDFGLYLTSEARSNNLHLWFHDVAKVVYSDPLVRPFETAPRSTYFYNFHGMIQNWRLDVERALRSPRIIDWDQLIAGDRLHDNDVITVAITPGALAPSPGVEAAVDFVLTSTLWWAKWLNVPDGETGANWTISTGAPWFGGRKMVDSVALWAHQVHNGQILTFSKAKGLGVGSAMYRLGGLERLPPNSRVTFTWVAD